MGRAQSPAESLFNELLAQAVTPILKPAGFRKTGANYHRRHGETVQVVNFQSSSASTSSEKRIYINAGIAFDAVCALLGVPILEKVKEYECDERGFRHRLQHFVKGAPDWWTLRAGEPIGAAVTALGPFIERLCAEFNRIDGLASFRTDSRFEQLTHAPVRAQVLYLLGDLDGSWREVNAIAARFSDRRNANRPDWWIEKLGLRKLARRGVSG